MTNALLWSFTRNTLAASAAAALCVFTGSLLRAQDPPLLRFGMVADIHYADIDDANNRHYREAADRLAEFVRVMNQEQVDFVIELGDFKDQDKQPNEVRTLGYLRHIESVFAGFNGPRFHVLGNHDVDSIAKEQFHAEAPDVDWMMRGDERVLGTFWRVDTTTGPMDFPVLSWRLPQSGIRIVRLDANHTSDGRSYSRGNFEWGDTNIGWEQTQRLERALAQSDDRAIVFVHQQLDGEGPYFVKDAAEVRKVLEASGKVLAVFQGHRHEGGYRVINGIPYYTLQSVAEGPGNAFALVTVERDRTVRVTGYGRAATREIRPAEAVQAQASPWVPIFNGRDLSGWTPKFAKHDLGVNLHETFRVEDGLLKVAYDRWTAFSGEFGHLFYATPYSYYRIAAEYRFVGDQLPAAQGLGWAVRNNGFMLHAQDPKTMTRDQDFPISIEVQFLGGLGTGPRPTANLCTPGTHVVLDGTLRTAHCTNSASKTYDGDQWVRVEVLVLGDSLIRHIVNGETVLEYAKPQIGGGNVSAADPAVKVDGTPLTGGYIAIQAETAPIEFRKIELMNLEHCKADPAACAKDGRVP